jgi:hypothetical protein
VALQLHQIERQEVASNRKEDAMPRIPIATLIAFLLIGCGGSEDPGTGTKTLKVVAAVEAQEQIPNAFSGNDFDVTLAVWVTRDNLPVQDALVVITLDGDDEILLDEGDLLKGRYAASRVGYPGSVKLVVESGEDNVKDAVLSCPDIHVFSNPTPGQVVPANQDLQVEWDRQGMADAAELESKKEGKIEVEDTGGFTLDASRFPGKPDKQEDDRVTLWRTKRVGLEGGVGGSELSVTVRNRVEFLIDTTP